MKSVAISSVGGEKNIPILNKEQVSETK